MYVNANVDHFPREEVRGFLAKKGIFYRSLPAGSIAQEMGAPLSSNLAMLGYFSTFDNPPFGQQELRSVIEKISPERFRQINLKIFDAGHERAMKEKGA